MSLKEAKKQLLYAFDDGLISDEECLLLYDLNRSTNLDFPYQQYPLFDLDDMQNDECLAEFRFHKNDLPILAEVLGIPDQFILEQRSVVGGMEALCNCCWRGWHTRVDTATWCTGSDNELYRYCA